jgi:hypothetical protein
VKAIRGLFHASKLYFDSGKNPQVQYLQPARSSDRIVSAFCCTRLNRNPLDLIERNLVAGAIIELRRARAFMRRHRLSILQSAAGFKICRDPRGSKRMAADADTRAEIGGAALDHAPGVNPAHRLFSQHAGAAGGGAEQGSLAGVADAGRHDVGVEIGFKSVMRRHLVALAALLMQAHPPALAVGVIILDAHGDDCADAREGEGHHRDQRAIPQADESRHVARVEQLARLFAGQHRGLAGLDDVLQPAHGMGWIGRDDLARHQPVEQHADRGEVLLDGRLLEAFPEATNIGPSCVALRIIAVV